MRQALTRFNKISLIIGFAFLYIPMLVLVIYSFNESKLVTVWSGFSFKWYPELFKTKGLWEAAKITLWLAVFTSTFSVILGTMTAFALVKFKHFKGKMLFSSITYAPMVMPEIIMGTSLALAFLAMNLSKGFFTILLAHITFTMCYVTVVVQSRLIGFDRHIEEAAMDLGADRFKTFIYITLPMIMPGVISGWLLSFTLSLDDLIIATFTTGPGATTLPLWIYSKARLGISPNINALSTIIIGIVATITFLFTLYSHHKEQREKRETE